MMTLRSATVPRIEGTPSNVRTVALYPFAGWIGNRTRRCGRAGGVGAEREDRLVGGALLPDSVAGLD